MNAVQIIDLPETMVSRVAELQRVAFDGYLNTRLGLPYLRAFIRWFYESEEAVALVAVDEANNPSGYVVGAPLGYNAALNRRILLPALLGISVRPWLITDPRFRQAAAGRMPSLLTKRRPRRQDGPQDLPVPVMSLVGIGVHPLARGQRIGSRLMDAFEQCARTRGAKSLRLSAYPDNSAARALYEGAGWSTLSDSHPSGALYYYKLL